MRIPFRNFAGNSSGSATFTAEGGYAIVGFMFGNTSNGGEPTWTHKALFNTTGKTIINDSVAKNELTSNSLTPEDIDPSYNGTLVFKALVIEVEYTLNLYFSTDDNQTNYYVYNPQYYFQLF